MWNFDKHESVASNVFMRFGHQKYAYLDKKISCIIGTTPSKEFTQETTAATALFLCFLELTSSLLFAVSHFQYSIQRLDAAIFKQIT